jgi:hypothetical protein
MGIKEIGDRIIVVTARSERQIDRRNYLYIAPPPISYFYIWCDPGGSPSSLVKVVASLLWLVLQQKHMFSEPYGYRTFS